MGARDGEAEDLPELLLKLEATLADPSAGSIRLYRLCAECLSAAVGLGSGAEVPGACFVV